VAQFATFGRKAVKRSVGQNENWTHLRRVHLRRTRVLEWVKAGDGLWVAWFSMGRGVFVSVEMGVLLGEEETGAVVLVEEAKCEAEVFEKKGNTQKKKERAERRSWKENAEGKKNDVGRLLKLWYHIEEDNMKNILLYYFSS